MTKFLLFLWFPLSVGIVHGMSKSVAMGMVLQHILLLLFPFYAVLRGALTGKYFHCGLTFIGFTFVFLHALIYNPQLSVFIKLLAIVGVIQWAYLVADELSFAEFIRILAFSAIFFFFLSVVFIVVFPDLSRQYFWGEYVLTSFYNQKNTYGRFLVLAIVFCLFHYLLNKNKVMLLMMGLIFLVLLGTSSRTSLAMSFICIAVVIAIKLRLLNFGLLQLGLTVMIAVLFYGIGSGHIYFNGLGSALDSIVVFGHEVWTTGRSTVWNSLFYQLSYDEKWLLGYGLDRFFSDRVLVNQSMGDIGLGVFMPSDPHNGYIDAILSYGVVGLCLWALIVIYLINGKGVSQLSDNRKAFVMVVLILMLVSNLSESFIVKSTNFYCFLFFYLFFMGRAQSKQIKLQSMEAKKLQ